MENKLLIVFFILIAFTANADQLDGLQGLGVVFTCIILGAISLLTMIFSSIYRITSKSRKPSKPLTFSGILLIICSLIAINTLGNSIDPGFLTVCVGLIIVSVVAIVLNYPFRKKVKE